MINSRHLYLFPLLCVYLRRNISPPLEYESNMLHQQVYSKSFAVSTSISTELSDKSPVKVKDAWLLGETEATRSQKYPNEDPLPPAKNKSGAKPPSSVIKPRVRDTTEAEDLISTEHLHLLKERFEMGGSHGKGILTLKEFMCFFKDHLHNSFAVMEELQSFYMKADSDYDGVITWDEFCTCCHAEIEPHLEKANAPPDAFFVFPAENIPSPSYDQIMKIHHLKGGNVVTCSGDGVVCVWSHDMEPRRTKKPELGSSGKAMWVTDMVVADELRKLILTTGDSSIQFYELSNFEPYCQLSYLENLPLKLDFWCDPKDSNNCILCYADDKCFLNILILPNISEDFKIWKKGAKKKNIPTCPLSSIVTTGVSSPTGLQFFRWKVHNNWISQLRYYGAVNCLFSSSTDQESSLVIGSPTGSTHVDPSLFDPSGNFDAGLAFNSHPDTKSHGSTSGRVSVQSSFVSTATFSRQTSLSKKTTQFARPNSSFPPRHRTNTEQRVFRINKGVNGFDYSNKYNVVVTGGMDRVVRVWNPYMPSKPICPLYGHISPVLSVFIAEGEERIYSVSFDNCIKVWNLLEYQCLITVIAGMHKIHSTIDVATYNHVDKCLVLGGDQLHVLKQRRRVLVDENVRSHDYPVVSVRYSSVFKQVVSVCEGSVMKTWSLENGKVIYEKDKLHGNSPMTAMILDPAERRAVTTSQNGEIKIWNQNTGQCLKTLKKNNRKEVTDLCYVCISSSARYLVCVGWDRQLNVFQDSLDTVQQVVVSGSNWTKSSKDVHKDDVTCVAAGGTNFLATASFDGEIVIWRFMSGSVFCRIRPTELTGNKKTPEGDKSVSKVMFLDNRMSSKGSASFVAGHYSGFVSFWNVYSSKKAYGCFNATRSQPISAMTKDTENTALFVGDTFGYIGIFNISDYCIGGPSDSAPECLNKWRAHAEKISCLEYVADESLLLSSSFDGCVRLWNLHGEFIGTFGQSSPWLLKAPSRRQTPHMPKEMVLNTNGLPHIPYSRSDNSQTVDTSSTEVKDTVPESHSVSDVNQVDTYEAEEDSLHEEGETELQLPRDDYRVGKRLRNYRTRESPLDRGGHTSHYHSLKCYTLSDTPSFSKPSSS